MVLVEDVIGSQKQLNEGAGSTLQRYIQTLKQDGEEDNDVVELVIEQPNRFVFITHLYQPGPNGQPTPTNLFMVGEYVKGGKGFGGYDSLYEGDLLACVNWIRDNI